MKKFGSPQTRHFFDSLQVAAAEPTNGGKEKCKAFRQCYTLVLGLLRKFRVLDQLFAEILRTCWTSLLKCLLILPFHLLFGDFLLKGVITWKTLNTYPQYSMIAGGSLITRMGVLSPSFWMLLWLHMCPGAPLSMGLSTMFGCLSAPQDIFMMTASFKLLLTAVGHSGSLGAQLFYCGEVINVFHGLIPLIHKLKRVTELPF